MSINLTAAPEHQQDPQDGEVNQQPLPQAAYGHLTSSIPHSVSEPIQRQARHVLLHDTVLLTPESGAISRGHFANLASLLERSTNNVLRSAVDAVALSLLASRFGMLEVRPMAVTRYMAAIRDLQAPNLAAAAGTQCLIASVYLLSLYEVSYAKELSPMFKSDVDSSLLIQMLNAGEANDMNCVMHLSGIIALMRHHSSDQPPPDAGIELLILGTDSSVETGPRSGGRPMYQQLGIARSPLHKLVSILPRVSGLFKKAGIILEPRSVRFESQLVTLKEEAI